MGKVVQQGNGSCKGMRLKDCYNFLAWVFLTSRIQGRNNFCWMMGKVINNHCIIDNFFSETTFNTGKCFQVLTHQVQIKSCCVKKTNNGCRIHDIVTTKGWNVELPQVLSTEMNGEG
ncbi:Uncharacterised protein [Streptococcus pneumoniae]|nr:Uncharacterised protein [Streptococcus pneumoniae]